MTTEKTFSDSVFIPGLDQGLSFVGKPSMRWWNEAAFPTTILNLASDEDHTRINNFESRFVPKQEDQCLAFGGQIALLRNATFHQNKVLVSGKYLLAGAAGSRAQVQLLRGLSPIERRNYDAHISVLNRTQKGGPIRYVEPPAPRIPICLDCRNLFNYYHFVAETVSAMATILPIAEGRDIFVHVAPPKDDKGFAPRLLKEFFPTIADRIRFVSDKDPVHYQQCLYPFLPDKLFKMLSEDHWLPGERKQITKKWKMFQGHQAVKDAHVASFLFDARVRDLRQHALSFVPKEDKPDRKIVVGRKSVRDRTTDSWGVLRGELIRNGFEEVFFEDLSALQQVEVMHSARVMVAQHGAGVTNVLYANSNTRFIEVGNVGSTGGRFASFYRLAQAAGCDFRVAYGDRAMVDGEYPPINHLAPVFLTPNAIDAILDHATSEK